MVKGTSPRTGMYFIELIVTMKNGNPLKVRDEMLKYKLALAANLVDRQKSPQASTSQSHGMKGPEARSPNQQSHGLKGPETRSPNQQVSSQPSQPMKSPQGKSPDLQQANQGAFQKYTKNPPMSTQQQRSPKASEPTPGAEANKSVPSKPKAQIPTSKNFRGAVTWFNNPGSFYLLPEESLQQVQIVEEILARYPDAQSTVTRPSVGDMVIANFENSWCRAVIEGISDDKAKVVYVDYGNTENVQINGLRKITDELRKLPVLAVHCALAGVVPSGSKSWNEEAIQMMKPKVSVVYLYLNCHRTSL